VSRLFVELYLDENVSVLVAQLVRARGFAATTTQEAGQAGKSDPEQLAYATSRRWAILTHNRVDFERLAAQHFTTGQTHCGIIIAVRRSPYEIVRRLMEILNHVTADEIENQVRYI
jgi:predicted nuclease of predicted toxin-antitoxin system